LKTLVTLILLGCAAMAHAQAKADNKMPVVLDCSTSQNDTIGPRLCTALRDKIATSPRYEAVSGNGGVHWGLHVVSVEDGELSSQAVTITGKGENAGEVYLTTLVYITGRNRASDQADAIFAALDSNVSDLLATYSGKK
jgi:hypothetical protein